MIYNFDPYLDDFNEIVIIINKNNYHQDMSFLLIGNNEKVELKIIDRIDIGDNMKIVTSFDLGLSLDKIYYVESNYNQKEELLMGRISRSPLFDSFYKYDGHDLGLTYTKEYSIFKLFAPTAKNVKLELLKDDNKMFYDMECNYGVWSVKIPFDTELYKYRYHFHINRENRVTYDPYSISMDALREYSVSVNPDLFYKMKYDIDRSKFNLNNRIIYEVSLRDYTYNIDIPDKSTYLGFVKKGLRDDENNKIGFDHLKDLGVTYIEFMPVFSFFGVSEINKDESYNWGYNPISFNTPSGYYSINPIDPYSRINELKQMIDLIHKENMGVILDVVYNHVYDFVNYPYELLIPGYQYIYDENGIRTQYSGCKNDINTRRFLTRKFIIDSIKYLYNEYHFDGLRFDIMGLIDVDTMNEIETTLKRIDKNIIVFGEGWKMVNEKDLQFYSHLENKKISKGIGFFNDRFRESIKNYAFNLNYDINEVINSIKGSFNLFSYSHQSINYIECHDNYTTYDYYKMINDNKNDDEIKKRCVLALSLNILSLGVPFIHSGSEFFRSKNGVRDTYNKGDEINSIKWNLVDENKDVIEIIKRVIQFRKESGAFDLDNAQAINENTNVTYSIYNTIFYKVKDFMIIFKTDSIKEKIDIVDNKKIYLTNLEINDKDIEGIGFIILK